MKRILLFSLSLVFALDLFAAKHNHSDENEVRYIKEKRVIDPHYQQLLRDGDLWQSFRANNGDWFVIFNEQNQLPHRAFGSPIARDLHCWEMLFNCYNFISKIIQNWIIIVI